MPDVSWSVQSYVKGVKIDGVVHICMKSPYRAMVGSRSGKTLCEKMYNVQDTDGDNCWLGELVETVVTCVACASKVSST